MRIRACRQLVHSREEEPLAETFPGILLDYSSDTELSFAVCCAVCGKQYSGIRRRFSKAKRPPASDGKKIIYQILYRREWEQLRAETIQSAKRQFNFCPVCQRLVCDNCFLICEELDMCKACAEELKEKGVTVTEE